MKAPVAIVPTLFFRTLTTICVSPNIPGKKHLSQKKSLIEKNSSVVLVGTNVPYGTPVDGYKPNSFTGKKQYHVWKTPVVDVHTSIGDDDERPLTTSTNIDSSLFKTNLGLRCLNRKLP